MCEQWWKWQSKGNTVLDVISLKWRLPLPVFFKSGCLWVCLFAWLSLLIEFVDWVCWINITLSIRDALNKHYAVLSCTLPGGTTRLCHWQSEYKHSTLGIECFLSQIVIRSFKINAAFTFEFSLHPLIQLAGWLWLADWLAWVVSKKQLFAAKIVFVKGKLQF